MLQEPQSGANDMELTEVTGFESNWKAGDAEARQQQRMTAAIVDAPAPEGGKAGRQTLLLFLRHFGRYHAHCRQVFPT